MKAFSTKIIHAFEQAKSTIFQLYLLQLISILLNTERGKKIMSFLQLLWNFLMINHFKLLFLSCLFSFYSPQVDLGFLRFVSAIGTQGAISQETRRIYFVKSYKVDVSSNGEDWITLKEGSKQKVGNSSPQSLCDKSFISQQWFNDIISRL